MNALFHTSSPDLRLRFATVQDVDLVLQFIQGLAAYEKMSYEVVADAETLRRTLFGPRPAAEVVLADYQGQPAGFALFFHNFSTFLGKPGLYLEDLFVQPDLRGSGIGRALLACLARIALHRDCGRLEWCVLDWNEPAIRFYRDLGALPMDEWTTFRLTGDALGKMAGTDPR